MSQNLTKVGIVGASGYTGEELVRVLARHPRVKLAAVCSRTLAGKSVADEIPRLRGIVEPALVFSASSPEECAKSDVDVWFLALPHGVAAEYAAPLVAAPTIASVPTSAPAIVVATKGEVLAAAPAPAAEVFVPPSFLSRQEPVYPERARRTGVEGVVGVRIALAADGSVRQVELTQSSGSRLLDEAALAAARASTFAPASRNRTPVESEAVASYRYELR